MCLHSTSLKLQKKKNHNDSETIKKPPSFYFPGFYTTWDSLVLGFSFLGQYQLQDTEAEHGTLKHHDQDWDLSIGWSWQDTLISGSVSKQRGKDSLENMLPRQWPPAPNSRIDPTLLLHPSSELVTRVTLLFHYSRIAHPLSSFTISLSHVYRKHVPNCLSGMWHT